ncbi:hypothetical protein CASFOL_041312 [Castilleja foliolosa]|uniref:F-box domain-containing protein n=1 Tax=Castilleja foliolosa TaxID=1961234 RepID=A0ABD3BE21_9LAMI
MTPNPIHNTIGSSAAKIPPAPPCHPTPEHLPEARNPNFVKKNRFLDFNRHLSLFSVVFFLSLFGKQIRQSVLDLLSCCILSPKVVTFLLYQMTNRWSKTCPPYKSNMPKATNIESLSDDILFEILLRVPAQDLYDSSRLVCRKWYNTIITLNFAHSHFQQSTPALLAVDLGSNEQAFMTMQNGRIDISKWTYGFNNLVCSSCNGLVVEIYLNSKPYILNHVTKQRFALPPLPSEDVMASKMFALAYVAPSNSYKVVGVSYSDELECDLVCAIMTVGVDTDWRRRDSTQHLSFKAKTSLELWPLTTRGFVHWARNDCTEFVVTMNVESEIITEIPGPCLRDDGKSLWCRYLPMGSYLSLFIGRGEFSWEVWKMKPETGKWTKMPGIDLEPQKVPKYLFIEFKRHRFTGPMLIPIGWSNSQEVLFFRVCAHTVGYNVRTREIDSCKLLKSPVNLFLEHKRSLLWLD